MNTGPSTTSIETIMNNGTTIVPDSFVQNSTGNEAWQAVTIGAGNLDPTATTNNVDNGSASGQTDPTDHFLSFKFDFNELVLALAEVGVFGGTDESAFASLLQLRLRIIRSIRI